MKNFTLAVALLITFSVQSQIGMGTPNPDASAVLELASTQKGFLPPRLTTLERDAIVHPPVGLTIFNTIKNCLEWYNISGWYNACGDNPVALANYTCDTLETGTMTEGIPVSGVSQTITAAVSFPGSYDISTTNNGVTFSAKGYFTSKGNHDVILHAKGTPIADGFHTFTISGTATCSFGRSTITTTVVGAAGKTWMAYNVGATAQPTSMNDIAQHGDLFQWGRSADGHEKLNSPLTSTTSNIDTPIHNKFITAANWRSPANDNLWQPVSGTNNPCPAGFRVPTVQEWNDEISKSNIKEKISAYNSVLKLTIGGYRFTNGGYAGGTEGYYWTSDYITNSSESKYIVFSHNLAGVNPNNPNNDRGHGMSVRCIKE